MRIILYSFYHFAPAGYVVVPENYLAEAVGNNFTAFRVLYRKYLADNVGVYVRVLERQVAALRAAAYKS